MLSHVRSFTSFSFFFLSTSLAFWPAILLLVALLCVGPVLVYWQGDTLLHLEMLISGVHLPENDWMLVFMVPAFIIGLPVLLAEYGGELMESQVEVYTRLIDFAATPFGLIGWLLAIGLMGALFVWSLWAVRQVLSLNDVWTSRYLAILTLGLGSFVFVI